MLKNQNSPASASPTIMMPVDDFPLEITSHGSVGFTKREVAAIVAMQGILAANKEFPAGTNDGNGNIFVARNAVSYADALFDALEKKETLEGRSDAKT